MLVVNGFVTGAVSWMCLFFCEKWVDGGWFLHSDRLTQLDFCMTCSEAILSGFHLFFALKTPLFIVL